MTERMLDICALGSAQDIHVANRTRALAEKGHRVTMLSPVAGEVPGVEVTTPPSGAAKTGKIMFMARALMARKPDVFYAHYASEYVCWLAALLFRRPFAIHAMGSDVLLDAAGQNGPVRAWLTKRALRWADLLTVKSPFIGEALSKMGVRESRVHVVLWGIDPEQYVRDEAARKTWREEWGLPGDAFVILSPRPLEALYRQHLMIEALPAVLAERPESHVVISDYNADPAYRDRIVNLAAAQGVADRVRIMPSQPAEKMPGLLSAADVMISLAYTDGTPQTVLEAQAVGTPVLMADIPDLRHVFTHGRDCWMVGADPTSISEALTDALSDNARRQSIIDGARALIEERANFPKDVARVETLLRGLAA